MKKKGISIVLAFVVFLSVCAFSQAFFGMNSIPKALRFCCSKEPPILDGGGYVETVPVTTEPTTEPTTESTTESTTDPYSPYVPVETVEFSEGDLEWGIVE